jgi:hypothetical protein
MAARNSASPQGSNMRRAMLDLMSAATGMVRFADHFLGSMSPEEIEHDPLARQLRDDAEKAKKALAKLCEPDCTLVA